MAGRFIAYVGATEDTIDDAKRDIERWGHGGIFITLEPGRRNLLRFRKPWDEGLY